jgi:hypothetical protein
MKAIKIFLLVLCGLSYKCNAQVDTFVFIPDSSIVEPIKLPEASERFKGWYFGLSSGVAKSYFRYEIPLDPLTGYNGTKSGGWVSFGSEGDASYEISNGRKMMFEANARYVVDKNKYIDFSSTIKQDGGNIILYDESYNAVKNPNKVYILNLTTNHLIITPNIFLGNDNCNFFFGAGIGITTILSRSGSFDRKYQFNTITPIYRGNVGLNVRVATGYVNINFSANRTGKLSYGGWRSNLGFNALTFGYALPLSIFKKKTKTATL